MEPTATPRTAVLITGRKRCGKDTVHERVLAPRGYARLALADPVKTCAAKLAKDMWGLDLGPRELNGLDGYDREAAIGTLALAGRPLTVRWLLQWVGTDLVRATVSKSVWIDALLEKAAKCPSNHIAITDVRFPNEATNLCAGLAKRGYRVLVLRVVRPVAAAADGSAAHMSESAQDAIVPDVVVHNDSTVEDLERAVSKIVDEHFGPPNPDPATI